MIDTSAEKYNTIATPFNSAVSNRLTPARRRGINPPTMASARLIGMRKHSGANHSSRCEGFDITSGPNITATSRLTIAIDRKSQPEVKKFFFSITVSY